VLCLQFIANEPNTLINVNVLSSDVKGNSRDSTGLARGHGTDDQSDDSGVLQVDQSPCAGADCHARIFSDFEIITQPMGE
jgi:hypothetical protein